jgi:integrase
MEFWGRHRKVTTLSRRDWDAFIHWRMSGSDRRVGKVHGKPVRARVVTQNLKTLRAILNWATMAGNEHGGYLLERDPLKGLPFPKEMSTHRPIITDKQYRAILKISRRISPSFELALVLAHETGHRIGSVRLLRWSDIDLTNRTVRWRAENDKIGFEHTTPLTSKAVQALQRARNELRVIGEAWLFPAPGDPS